MKKNDYKAPWSQNSSGAGIQIKSANGTPIMFIYGINKEAKAIAEAILNLEFSFSHDK